MPEIGDIINGTKIGRSRGKNIWSACIDCGRERWTVLRKGKPESIIGNFNDNPELMIKAIEYLAHQMKFKKKAKE